jgi:hypothetical protein
VGAELPGLAWAWGGWGACVAVAILVQAVVAGIATVLMRG